MRWRPGAVARAAAILALASCTTGAPPGSAPSAGTADAASAGEVTLYAASSLADAARQLAVAYRAETGTHVVIATDASSALAAQIEQGAPADVFASADVATPQTLIDRRVADPPLTPIARNRLVLVVRAGILPPVRSAVDLARPGLRVIAAGDAVPVTKYAAAVLARVAARTDAPPEYLARVAANTASREDNVRGVLAKVELGDGDAAIVYATDARTARSATTIEIPEAAAVSPLYGAVAITGSRHHAAAVSLLRWLTGPTARAILRNAGFADP